MILRKLVVLLIIYLVVRFFIRVWSFRKTILSQRDAFLNQMQQNQREQRPEGEVHILNKNETSGRANDEGSFVDYEEVE
ncbi:MAG: hypothetical protein H6607_08445 [Flavobacteriales bacterium]|nr:hypothetical protein [Flavobacteriales bacterium]